MPDIINNIEFYIDNLDPREKALLPRDATIAEMSIEGMTTREIGRKLNLDHGSIARRLKKPYIQKILEAAHALQIANVPAAVNKLVDKMNCGDDLVELKAAVQFLKNGGLAPSNAQTTYINNIYNDNRQININPEVQHVIDTVMNREVELIEG